MNAISRLFSLLIGKKRPICKCEEVSSPTLTSETCPIEEKCYESGTFCRESRIDQVLTKNSGKEEIKTTITRTLDRWNPEPCVRLLRMPSVQNYSGLSKLISESDPNWMIEFLEIGGLEVLFESVDRLSNRNSYTSKLERTLLLLQCIKYLKAVIHSPVALEHIIEQASYVQTIAQVLTSSNPMVKKQLFNLMSTLCIFSENGHYYALNVLEHYQVTHKLRYKFSILLIEMKQAEVIPYIGGVFELINCIILGACGFRFRVRLRNEFLALGLQDFLESLKEIPEEEIQLQCRVFEKSQQADEEYARSLGIHFSFSHFAVFQALLDKIEDTPLSASLLVVLQNLVKLDQTDTKTDRVWSILEEITERASHGIETVLHKKKIGESLKSTATQTTNLCTPSSSLEDCEKLCLCGEDSEKESLKSFRSLDSGIPVSRNQSFTSHHAESPDGISSTDKITEPFSVQTFYETKCLVLPYSDNEKLQTNAAPDDCSSLQTLNELFVSQTQRDISKVDCCVQFPIPIEGGKTKKSFSFPFFNRSKKYSLPKPSPTGQQSSGAQQSLREGMTSIDIKKSRKQIFLRESAPIVSKNESENESQSQKYELGKPRNGYEEHVESPIIYHPDTTTISVPPPPPPPPPPPLPAFARSKEHQFKSIRSSWSGKELEKLERRQHNTLPMPKSKMRTLNWTMIPSSHVSVQSIWSEINRESEQIELNFEEMEKLFSQNERQSKESKIKQTTQVSLLDNKRCLSIGVFLKQFKGGPEEVIKYISQFKHKEIGAERLRTLLNLLPTESEIKLLHSYSRKINDLGIGERFLIQLIGIDCYECLVEGMLLMEEFPTTLQILHESVQNLLDACKELLTNQGLKKFLKIVLVSGNFMNTGSYAGNAVGFRLSTLPKLLETRANKPRITLLHYLVQEMQRKSPDSINFTNQLMEKVNRCSRLAIENLTAEITQLDKTMRKLNSQIEENEHLKNHFAKFIEKEDIHLSILKRKMDEINVISSQLAKRFCEDEKKFQLEDCLNVISELCAKIKIAHSDNETRRKAGEKKT